MKRHITRAYNSFSINKKLGTITKTSQEERLKNEINYYKQISQTNNKASIFFPRLLGSYENTDGYGMELEYYAYDNLGDYMVYRDYDEEFWTMVATSLQEALTQFSHTQKDIKGTAIAQAMYVDKTERYYQDLVKNFDKFRHMAHQPSIKVNGTQYLNFEEIWDDVKTLIQEHLLDLKKVSIIHGDFCFSNILCGVNTKTDTALLRFVDPRGNFGQDGIFGDPHYDAAKLVHSYQGGYEYIIYDKFKVDESTGLNTYEITFANDNKEKINKVFEEMTDFKNTCSKLIEGLIYIGMCSRHYDSEARQTAMYLNGIRILNEVLEN
jgi:hypothetical protein